MQYFKFNIGFSTGSLALGDFKAGIDVLKEKKIRVVELSALRENELDAFLDQVEDLDLKAFDHISFHAPSKLHYYKEQEFVDILLRIAQKKWLIIVHPDIISDYNLWLPLGEYLCIENMDKRKSTGRTAHDIQVIFDNLPYASFCLDLAHARQVDSTMAEANLMIQKFSHRLKQIHLSDVNSQSKHEPLTLESLISYSRLFETIPKNIPIILESPVDGNRIETEIEIAALLFNSEKIIEFLKPYSKYSTYFQSYLEQFERADFISEKNNQII